MAGMPYPPNKRGAVETTAPPGDSGGIQTHDLQNRKLIANSYYCAVGQPIGNTCNSLLNHI